MKDLKQASARGAAWNLLQNLTSRLLGLVVVAILSRLLEPSAFGGVALALAITTFAELIVNQGYGEFITQTSNLDDEHLDTAFWFNALVATLLAVAVAVAAQPLARWLGDESATGVIQWCSLSLIVRSLSVVPQGLLVRQLRFRTLSMRTVIASIIGGTVGIVAALAGLGVYSLVLQLVTSDLAATVILWTATEWRPKRRVTRRALAELSAFGTPMIGAALLGVISRRLDAVIVSSAIGLAMLGVYSLGQRVFQIMLQVLNKSSVEVVFSALSRLAGTTEERRHAFYKVIELTAVLCFPTYVGLAIVVEPVTLALFGARWSDSAAVLRYFALSGIPFSLTLIHMAALKSAAKTRAWLLINLILTCLYLPVMLVLVEHGPAPAAAASLIGCVLILPFEIMFLRDALGIAIGKYLRTLVGACCASAVMAGAAVGIEQLSRAMPVPVRLGAIIGVGVVTYLLALRVIAPATFRRCLSLAKQTVRRPP